MLSNKSLVLNLLVLTFILSFTCYIKAGIIDSNFQPTVNVTGRGYNVAQQSDGKFIVAGLFTAVNSASVNNISRFNSDGSIDTSFNSGLGANRTIYSLAIQPDGKIIAGGAFTKFNGQVKNHLVRLNPDGSVDSTFNVNVGEVYSISVQTDLKILIGGYFNELVIRLNCDGSRDTTFTSNTSSFGGTVVAITVQPDQKILVGGAFSQFSNSTSANLVRLNQNGSVDTSFNIGNGPNNGVVDFAIQQDGKIIIGGSFTLFRSSPAIYIARLNPDGSRDTSYPNGGTGFGFTDSITSLKLQSDGRLVVGGFFTTFSSDSRNRILRLMSDGSLDSTFDVGDGFNNTVRDIILNNEKTIVVGDFSSFNSIGKFGIAQLNNNGSIDSNFNLGLGLPTDTYTIKRQVDGKILIGGNFDSVNGISKQKIARLNINGELDYTFAPLLNFGGPITSIDLQSDGKILVAGQLIQVNNIVKYLVRLNSDGSLDNTFNSNLLSNELTKVKILSDGKILIAGNFETVGAFRKNLARLNSNGSLDESFVTGTGFNGVVSDFEIQSDSKIVVCGYFTNYNGVSKINVARLDQDGAIDQSLNINPSPSGISDVAIQPDGRLIIGGTFNTINGVSRNAIARINSDSTLDTTFTSPFTSSSGSTTLMYSNGKILVGGILRTDNTGTSKPIVQLNENGSVNNSINPNIDGFTSLIENLHDGSIIIAGRLNTPRTVPVDESLNFAVARILLQGVKNDFDHDGKADISVFRPENGSWYIQQSQAGFTGLAFGLSTDKLVPADYDGDGKTDVAVVRNGTWYLQRSSLGFTGVQFGDGNDIPVPADYDGDGKAELAAFRPSNGYWYILNLVNNQFTATLFGLNGDKPVPADYDGDGKADIAVNRNGNWYLNRSQLGFTGILFGDANDKLVPADYDGDGKTDIAVFRPSNGSWYIQQSTAGFRGIAFGLGTDIPVAADYDGDGKADVAVVRNGNWYLNRSSQGFTGVLFGTSTDLPIPNAFVK